MSGVLRNVGVVLVAAGLMVLAACSGPVTPSGARQVVADVPVPAGAVVVGETSEFGPVLERGFESTASRTYAVPTPLDAVCPTVLRLAMDAGYTAVRPEIGVDLPRITDPEAACAADRERSRRANNSSVETTNVMVIFPRGAETRYLDDGIHLVTTAPAPGSPYPAGSTLRVGLRM